MLILTPQELEELTEYKRPADQVKWLRSKGIPFFLGAKGNPKVLRDALIDKRTEPKLGEVT